MEKAPYKAGDLVELGWSSVDPIANGCNSLPIKKARIFIVMRIWWSEIEGRYLVKLLDQPGDWPAEAFYRPSRQRHFAAR